MKYVKVSKEGLESARSFLEAVIRGCKDCPRKCVPVCQECTLGSASDVLLDLSSKSEDDAISKAASGIGSAELAVLRSVLRASVLSEERVAVTGMDPAERIIALDRLVDRHLLMQDDAGRYFIPERSKTIASRLCRRGV